MVWVIFSSESYLDRFNIVKATLVENSVNVELENLSAFVNHNSVTLNWSTSSETNNTGFKVERKNINSGINSNWLDIGFVSGHGTTVQRWAYSFTDSNLVSGRYLYRLLQTDTNGNIKIYNFDFVEVNIPLKFNLEQNYPNPFNPVTLIHYSIYERGNVRINIYDLNGNLIKELVNELLSPGSYKILWDGKNDVGKKVSSGVYFYELLFEGTSVHSMRKKMLLLK